MNDFQCKILSSQRGEKDEWVVALWGGGGSGKVRSLRRGAWSLEVLVSKIAWGITVTLTELGVAAKAWIGGERLGSWPKVRLRVSEIVICEWESKTRENRENRGELCELWGWGKEILGFITLYIYIYQCYPQHLGIQFPVSQLNHTHTLTHSWLSGTLLLWPNEDIWRCAWILDLRDNIPT